MISFIARQWKNPNFYIMLVSDGLFFVLALVGAYLLRFEFQLSPSNLEQIKQLLGPFVCVKLGTFLAFGLYRGMWRYTSLQDMWRLAQACALASMVLVSWLAFAYRLAGFSRAVLLLDPMLTFMFTACSRVMIRYVRGLSPGDSRLVVNFPGLKPRRRMKAQKNVVIIGAGQSGEKILREIYDNPHLHYNVVGFLDDDPEKIGRSLHGVGVLGRPDELPLIAERKEIHEVFIAIPSASGKQMRRLVGICDTCGIAYKTLPGIGEIMDGKVSIKALRDVAYEDLLGRPPVSLDTKEIARYLAGRTVLVTGCGGSIGSELCRQIIRFDPRKLILMDAGEANLYQIQMELEHEKGFHRYCAILGDVRNRALVESVFSEHRPEVVFHAAAYKHVPMIEKNPWEAIFNNVLGSKVIMEISAKYGVQHFVLVSTDKAVRPTNVMGASKRVTELIMLSLQGHSTRFMGVRFGNVVGSSGSVIPLFRRQIECGGPVTVTHPEVTRYFMTIPEAAQLILQAGSMGEGGEIFILEMGSPVKIADMARDLIRLSGKEPGEDIEIVFTGLREGEKLYEELITVGEGIVATHHEKIMVLSSNGKINGHGNPDDLRRWLDGHLKELFEAAERFDTQGIRRKLKEIVPEYQPENGGQGPGGRHADRKKE
ncbi:NDP-sugar epimerase, includes UDP-GlcNAc-inverting 4,6-dehydratase FlaA1 and capsular polysaccharide biosynthesis protein EpsC [Desulfacinum hydrothermale DSM 13146]|uniref:NDP-sugar epimerase, includes UDP-GlcNAc-inverting 4,6-dehydratase FlaA1 and capsular polysaccharide biosynthesis protein EpsC n=1 Tax=Desulfacinum hydrothermale DSM 13146 TaxID=1121390 RepID=A0A1W1XRN4_9BACT|nr:nucleoside-diphosphate sugar epimerase/dehydratase [Desulfacinum hydrothermale]SMC26515.1 NDP-sugar epimerase, includes UDP-GlcNAc-inverting 4,6-dehydratase FlaA1 and capsular polysaccharide biosynthesis protein EpsC [Desulfacinum hydrothermale DSM 13146]